MPGERVLWSGRPGKPIIVRAIDGLLIPFSLFWGGFAFFWNFEVWTAPVQGALPFKLFGLPFLAVGVYLIAGRFFVDAYRLQRLRYFITDQRIVMMREGSGWIQSLDIKRLPNLAMKQRPDGSGSLLFGEEAYFSRGAGFGTWQATAPSPPRFLAVPNVASVFQLIRAQAGRA
jgi:hypothetical protein